jgi:hypothetical protein
MTSLTIAMVACEQCKKVDGRGSEQGDPSRAVLIEQGWICKRSN